MSKRFIPLEMLLLALAAQSRRLVSTRQRFGLPDDEYLLEDAHCTEPGCDCEKLWVGVFSKDKNIHFALSEHDLAPAKKSHSNTRLLSKAPQSNLAPALFVLVQEQLANDNYTQTKPPPKRPSPKKKH